MRSWRDTRAMVAAYMVGLIWVCWDVMRHAPVSLGAWRMGIDGWHYFSILWGGLAIAFWLIGGTAPRKEVISGKQAGFLRSSSISTHSVVGLTEVIALTTVTMGVFTIMYHFTLIFFSPVVVVSNASSIQAPPLFLTAFLAGCSMALFAGLVFSTTCLATILARRAGLGLALAGIAFILYIFLQREMQYLPGSFHPNLPNWQLNPFDILLSENNAVSHLLIAIVGRCLTIAFLLYLAHVAARRIEIGHRELADPRDRTQP